MEFNNLNDNLLEGIGEEVVYATCTFVVGVTLIAFFLSWPQKLVKIFLKKRTEALSVPARPYSSTMCPICLSTTTLALETNCGHKFCGRCMIHYWRHGNFGLSAMRCAMCRQQVNMLFSIFSPEELAALQTSVIGTRRDQLLEDMNTYNRTFSGEPRTCWQMLIDSPVLVRHMLNDLLSDRGIMRMFQLRIVCCVIGGILYLLSPLDILPEALFGIIGFLDDVLVLLMLFVYMSTIYHRIMLSRANSVGWQDSDQDD